MTMLLAVELATELRCSVQTVYRMAREGKIPGIRVGRSWRFDLDEVKGRLSTPVLTDAWARKGHGWRRWTP